MEKLNIVVTGVGGDIGYEIILALQNLENVHVYAYSRKPEKLHNYFGDKANITLAAIDLGELVRNPENSKDLGLPERIDVLINNAGFLNKKPFEAYAATEIQHMVNVNFTGTMLFTQLCLPRMKTSPKAHIVNISSMGGVQGTVKFPGLAVYAASKAAIAGFTEVLAEEYKPKGIQVNCLALGAVKTKMFKEAFPGEQAPQSPDKTAAYIVDFALNQRNFFNGKIIPVATTTP